SRDAGREAEVVLDPSGGTGLAAERAAIQSQDRKTLRSRINGRRHPGRARADHDHVVDLFRIDAVDQADASTQLLLRWVAQQIAVWAEDDWELFAGDLEPRDKGLTATVVQGVEPLIWMAVPPEEIDQPKHVGIGFLAYDDRAGPSLDQPHPPKDQGAHNALAQ